MNWPAVVKNKVWLHFYTFWSDLYQTKKAPQRFFHILHFILIVTVIVNVVAKEQFLHFVMWYSKNKITQQYKIANKKSILTYRVER